MAIEIVHCGNLRAALHAIGLAREGGALDRVILGNDAPSGTGVVPLGILRTMAHLSSLGGVAPEIAVALATGNTARVHRLDTGVIARGPGGGPRASSTRRSGRPRTPRWARWPSATCPGVGMVLIDGSPVIGRSRNTPPAARVPTIVKGTGPGGAAH